MPEWFRMLVLICISVMVAGFTIGLVIVMICAARVTIKDMNKERR